MQFRSPRTIIRGTQWISLCAALFACQGGPPTIALPDSPLGAADTAGPLRDDAGTVSRNELDEPDEAPLHAEYSDRDGDGLSDAYELAHESDPNTADSDRDGVSDLVESVAGTAPGDPSSNPTARGDFYFMSPFGAAPEPVQARLDFSTALRSADLMLLVDTTGSMQPALSLLRDKLRSEILPGSLRAIADLHVGVASFQDFAVAPYGDPGDVAFAVLQLPTADADEAQRGVDALRLGSGGDGPESGIVALHALATGQGLGNHYAAAPSCSQGGRGSCFRAGAVPIVLLISDAEFHNGPGGENPYSKVEPAPPDYAAARAALGELHARVISIRVMTEGGGTGEPATNQMRALSRDTGAIGMDRQALYFSVDASASGLDARVVDAVSAVAEQVPIDVSVRLRDDPGDDVDATQLVERIVAHAAPSGDAAAMSPSQGLCTSGLTIASASNRDAFSAVKPGSRVCFDLIARKNASVPATPKPVVYRAYVDVIGDGISTLDTRAVYFLVPPSTPVLY